MASSSGGTSRFAFDAWSLIIRNQCTVLRPDMLLSKCIEGDDAIAVGGIGFINLRSTLTRPENEIGLLLSRELRNLDHVSDRCSRKLETLRLEWRIIGAEGLLEDGLTDVFWNLWTWSAREDRKLCPWRQGFLCPSGRVSRTPARRAGRKPRPSDGALRVLPPARRARRICAASARGTD